MIYTVSIQYFRFVIGYTGPLQIVYYLLFPCVALFFGVSWDKIRRAVGSDGCKFCKKYKVQLGRKNIHFGFDQYISFVHFLSTVACKNYKCLFYKRMWRCFVQVRTLKILSNAQFKKTSTRMNMPHAPHTNEKIIQKMSKLIKTYTRERHVRNMLPMLSPATDEFPSQMPVTWSFDFVLCLNKRLSLQSQGWWFETPSRSLWRHCNDKEWETYLIPSHPGRVTIICSH